MSDLTRRVLAWDAADPDEYECFDPMPAMADAATTLARQVEAVEALADRLENEGIEGVRASNRTPHDSGWHDSQIIAAARIRDALTSTEKGNTP